MTVGIALVIVGMVPVFLGIALVRYHQRHSDYHLMVTLYLVVIGLLVVLDLLLVVLGCQEVVGFQVLVAGLQVGRALRVMEEC
jgi:hypothetical protein